MGKLVGALWPMPVPDGTHLPVAGNAATAPTEVLSGRHQRPREVLPKTMLPP